MIDDDGERCHSQSFALLAVVAAYSLSSPF